MKNCILFLIGLFLFASCEEEPVPLLDIEVPPGTKTVLIEDFTGVRCANCPRGARAIDNFKAINNVESKRVISVAVYTRTFDQPYPESDFNFFSEEGQELQDYIDVLIGKPAASFNRHLNDFNERFYLVPDSWQDPVSEELARPSEVNISLEMEYDSTSRRITGQFNMVPVIDIDETLNYTVLIAESHIIDPQLDGPGIGLVMDYEHNHVLRDILTQPSGNPLGNGNRFVTGEVYTQPFSFTIPPEDGWWVAENCEIIAFVHLADGSERRVLQAISKDVVEQE